MFTKQRNWHEITSFTQCTLDVCLTNSINQVIKAKKKYSVHDKDNKFKNGDKVTIVECKPYSKSKKFEVLGDSKWYKCKPNF